MMAEPPSKCEDPKIIGEWFTREKKKKKKSFNTASIPTIFMNSMKQVSGWDEQRP